MKLKAIWTLALLCTVVQGFGAVQITEVSTKEQLTAAITNGANIQLTADILLSAYLNIEGKTVTIDLNGHKLYRNLSSSSDDGHIFWINNNGHLTIADNSDTHSGSIEGGKATNGGGINVWPGCSLTVSYVTFKNNGARDNGGAIFVRNGANVTISNATFIGNFAADHAGAIWNNGTLTATNCTFENNTATDVGGIYNSVTETNGTTYAGAATLSGCTFTGNAGTAGAGALANALGATEMTIEDCTIQDNTAYQYGAGIWNGGTLNMQGEVKVTDNMNVSGLASNVYLKTGNVITVTGSLTGSSIGVEMESTSGMFTSGFGDYVHTSANIFTADRSSIVSVIQYDNEIYLDCWHSDPVTYIERSWDSTNKKVVSTEKGLSTLIAYDATPHEWEFKEVTSAPADSPNQWFRMGGYSDDVAEYYVVRGTVKRETVVIQGKNVHLILCDGATLTLTGGLKLEGDNKLYIHCQSYGRDMGRLMVTNSFENAAGIGSAHDNGNEKKVGELVIQGGHIEATGGEGGAGIGSCRRTADTSNKLCNRVTVYGGYVKATGGEKGAGIGGGASKKDGSNGVDGGEFILYDGTVVAKGGLGGAGVGGGGLHIFYDFEDGGGNGGKVIVYGGSLEATGGDNAAGIGSGHLRENSISTNQSSVELFIFGGTVTAIGNSRSAGIGGGWNGKGGDVTITGGTVTANGGFYGAGIGGGDDGDGGTLTITGGKVTATGGNHAAGIGGGKEGKGGVVTITGGNIIAKSSNVNCRAFGPGANCENFGTLTINESMMVGAGNNGSVERIYNADERVNACWFRSYAEVSPCTHPGATYTMSSNDAYGTHTMLCSHCTTTFKADPHEFDEIGECSVCHYKGEAYTVIIYLPDADEDGRYTTDGAYKPYAYGIVAGTTITLPGAPQDLYDMDFAGWLVTTDAFPSFSTYRTLDSEPLLAESTEYTPNGDVSFVARYKDIAISLADNSDNAETLYNYDGRKVASVTLDGRTLYKDGNWNTLCLPFDVDGFSGTPLEGAIVKTLESALFNDGTLTLNFTKDENNLTAIDAGKPYIIKWDKANNYVADGEHDINNPAFSNVIINSEFDDRVIPLDNTGDQYISFMGIYSPYSIEESDNTLLYLSADNTLYYPSEAMTIGSCRAFFQLNDITAGDPVSTSDQPIKSFVLNFGEETGISEISKESRSQGVFGGWFTFDGRKLEDKPTQKGMYICGGRKVIIK